MNLIDNPFAQGKVLLVNKPLRWTSFNVVSKIRYLSKTKKVGHAGTLDPLATGLLIVCTGKFTKKINEYMAQEKEYTGTITLGSVTPTFDLESEPMDFKDYSQLTESDIEAATVPFTGLIYQKPPIHSAIKKDGKRVYELARKGIEVEMEARPVTIKVFEITGIDMPLVHFRVVCSTGTYIRSLANDFGAALGVGGHLSALCRTRIGAFTLNQSQTVEELEQTIPAERLAGSVGQEEGKGE
ncbi:tRNA pseudouridine synthase B [Cnuella takakiae]|uniref:tRNA pseudouridine synthase B n=1 Tax=Cnuella takakiae TaxID=1302690 RepID=A0A1M4YC81_9BACT|nr:tRNA pseudouridine(55) synthase TruB [Cnuella takakiae]OLY93107.1 tRNA pseudouridine(55) synthase TruB [Cnuella takakiae]SHF03279.1 tRNA pseudouridine synthase B [Cnuella takakiae]